MNLKATANLGVDAGMMSLVPAELYTGKYESITKAIAQVKETGGALDASGVGIVFRNDVQRRVYVAIDTIESDVSNLFITDNYGILPVTACIVSIVKLDPGIYILADPCYVLDNQEDRTEYFTVCMAIMPGFNAFADHAVAYNKAVVALVRGFPIPVCESGIGDGNYPAVVDLSNGLHIEVEFLSDYVDAEDY